MFTEFIYKVKAIICFCRTQKYVYDVKGDNQMTKMFVLRINSLMSSPSSPLRFGTDNEVVIPLAVIDQLQGYKGMPEKKKVAESILSYIETFDIQKLMNGGERQANGSILKIEKNFHNIHIDMEGITSIDKRVFQVCLGLQQENPDKKVVLVSKNKAIRIKARALGINAEDFKDDLFPTPAEQYTGRIHLETTADSINRFFKNKFMPISEIIGSSKIEWVCNMFTEVKAVDNNQCFIGRYDGEKIVPLVFGEANYPMGISAKNAGQRMLIECLLMDWEKAPLVIAKGGAGTGKTFCTLAAALQGYEDDKYSRVLLAAPPETVGKEVGYLPGDIKDKFFPHMSGIMDNLDILINGSKKYGKSDKNYVESGQYYFEQNITQLKPIGYLRGSTIVNSIFIIDETQNIDPGDIKSIVTRAAEGSKFVFLGDPTQVDNPKLNERYNGLVYLSEKFKGNPLCWQISMKNEESVRSTLSTIASKIL